MEIAHVKNLLGAHPINLVRGWTPTWESSGGKWGIHYIFRKTWVLCALKILQITHTLEVTYQFNTSIFGKKYPPLSLCCKEEMFSLLSGCSKSSREEGSCAVGTWAAAVIISQVRLRRARSEHMLGCPLISPASPIKQCQGGWTQAPRGFLTGFLERATTTQQGSGNWVMWARRKPQQLCSS